MGGHTSIRRPLLLQAVARASMMLNDHGTQVAISMRMLIQTRLLAEHTTAKFSPQRCRVSVAPRQVVDLSLWLSRLPLNSRSHNLGVAGPSIEHLHLVASRTCISRWPQRSTCMPIRRGSNDEAPSQLQPPSLRRGAGDSFVRRRVVRQGLCDRCDRLTSPAVPALMWTCGTGDISAADGRHRVLRPSPHPQST